MNKKDELEWICYLSAARDHFVNFINGLAWDATLRTHCEDLLIAYDQARERVKDMIRARDEQPTSWRGVKERPKGGEKVLIRLNDGRLERGVYREVADLPKCLGITHDFVERQTDDSFHFNKKGTTTITFQWHLVNSWILYPNPFSEKA